MNHNCNGDFYTFEGKEFYRCLADSTVIAGAVNGETCGHCKRRIDGIEQGEVTGRRFVVTEVEYDGQFHGHSSEPA